MSKTNPSKFAVIEVGWGSNKAHIYTTQDMAEIEYHRTEAEARARASVMLESEGARMVAVMEVKCLLEAKVTAKEVA